MRTLVPMPVVPVVPVLPLLPLLLLVSVATAQDDLKTAVATVELGRNYDDALLRRAAQSEDAATRRAAARAAGRIKDERAMAWLLPLLKDSVGPVRRASLFALGQIGSEAVVIPLREVLSHLQSSDLPHALEALGKTGDPRAVATVTDYLRNVSPDVRGEAALALFRLRDDSALPDLFAALAVEKAREPRWRMVYAVFALLRAKARRAKGPIEVDEEWWTRLEALTVNRGPYQERIFAALALGSTKQGKELLIPLLEDEDARIVVAAMRGLGTDWQVEVAAYVEQHASHADELVREAVVRYMMAGIRAKKPGAENHLAPLRRKLAPARLALLAREAEAPVRKDAAVAADAPEELAWRVNSHFPDKLPAALPKTQKGKMAAADVCGEERVPAKKALPVLLGLLKEKDFAVRSLAISSLAKRKAKQHVAEIVAAAKASPGPADMDVRSEAANALGALGVYDPWLLQAAGDEDFPVRDAARAALEKLRRPLPPAPPPSGFRLHRLDAAGVLEAARALRGARVTLKTNRGSIVMVLYPDEAPAHCVNFATLVRKGFYDQKSWHRVVADFVIQGGCPRGDGWGGPGYMLPDEIGTRPYVRGTVGMPKAGDDTGGCQIFITHLPTPHLDGRYTVYAQVIEGLEVVDSIRVGDTIEKATLQAPG